MIDRQTIEHIARLSRLQLTEEEMTSYGEQLGGILNYVDQLNQLDTTGVEPASHALPTFNVFREDVVKHTLSEEQVFQNAPDREEQYFKVPRILG